MLVGRIHNRAQDNDLAAEGTDPIRLAASKPLDVVSEFKPGKSATNLYDVIGSVAIPFLTLESVSYRFGLTDNATQTITLRGDSVFYNPSTAFVEETSGPFAKLDTVALAHPANVYRGDAAAGPRYVLSASLVKSGKRLLQGSDYFEDATGVDPTTGVATVALRLNRDVAADDAVRIVYASPTTVVEDGDPAHPGYVHAKVSDGAGQMVRPAAIRGKNISVYVGKHGVDEPLTALNDRWTAVQSVNVDWRVTLDRDEEFGNTQVVAQDFDVPETTGSIELRPRDYQDLYERVAFIAGVNKGEVVGALTAVPLKLLIVLHNPETGAAMKSLYIPDARFTFPGFSGQVQAKLNITLNWESDSGDFLIYPGQAPATVFNPATTANAVPVAEFTNTVNGLLAQFTDASTDADGTIASRAWDFGDGATSTTTSPQHTYADPGTYTVALTVTDNNGASKTVSHDVTVA